MTFRGGLLALLLAAETGALAYDTNCVVDQSNTLDGYVANRSLDQYQVTGEVQFSFWIGNSMSRPVIQLPGSGVVPSGQTVRVARTRLLFQLKPGEQCRLDVTNAIRKL